MGEFFNYTKQAAVEHYCPEHWIPDPDNLPHEKCSICGKHHLLAGESYQRAVQTQEAQKEENFVENYEVEIPSERKPGEDWDGTWSKWSSGKGRETWGTLKRVQAAIRTAGSPPIEYKIVKVLTRPEVVIDRIVVEEHGTEVYADYNRIDYSRNWKSEGERPVSELDSEDAEAENDRTRVQDVPSVVDYDPQDGENMKTRFEESFKIRVYNPEDVDTEK